MNESLISALIGILDEGDGYGFSKEDGIIYLILKKRTKKHIKQKKI